MKRRKGLKREGKKGKEKRMARKNAREYYFTHFGTSDFGGRQAPCQICKLPMSEDDQRTMFLPTAAHKRARSLGGSDELHNFVIAPHSIVTGKQSV